MKTFRIEGRIVTVISVSKRFQPGEYRACVAGIGETAKAPSVQEALYAARVLIEEHADGRDVYAQNR